MRSVLLSVLLASAMTLPAPLAAQDAKQDITGLWAAKKRFGPDVRGTLTLVQEASGWRAEIAGREATVTQAGDTLRFALAGELGGFRGRIQGNRIRGHWIQPRSVTGGMRYATPVVLAAAGPSLWRGEVRPLDESFTLYLKIDREADGRLGVFLRNPDRNIGRNVDLRHIELKDGHVRLLGKPGGATEEVEIATGNFDAGNRLLSIAIPGRGNSYDFEPAGALSDFYPRPNSRHPMPIARHCRSRTAGRSPRWRRKGSTARRSSASSRC